MYEFLAACDHARLEMHYPLGARDELVDWHKKEIRSAIIAGLIREVTQAGKEVAADGKDSGPKRQTTRSRI